MYTGLWFSNAAAITRSVSGIQFSGVSIALAQTTGVAMFMNILNFPFLAIVGIILG
jgi:hypothetical protein